ncbi:MAG: hypothetical protein Q9221_001085 [Calogaya cf. arnoldii]
MADPLRCEEEPNLPSAGPICDTCKKPDMSNMTWEDGAKNFFSTYFAAPRMWPIGYILGSPYSPFSVERDIESKNWRNAFEDLLALESGRGMIPEQDRKAEHEHAVRTLFESASYFITRCNRSLDDNKRREAETRLRLQQAEDHKEKHVVEAITDYLLPWIESDNQRHIANAQEEKASFELLRNLPASHLMMRGQWITSLITSGALPGWKSAICSTTVGQAMDYSKRNSPPDLDASFTISELELQQVFAEGHPYDFRDPPEFPTSAAVKDLLGGPDPPTYPEIPNDPFEKFRPSNSSIIHQSTECDLIKMPDGSIGPKAKILNTLVDGRTEAKEFVHNPVGVLEETKGAEWSMMMMRVAIGGTSDPRLKRAEELLYGHDSQEVSNLI